MMQRQHSVVYTFDEEDSKGMLRFDYERVRISTGSITKDRVWCYNEKDFITLIRIWNGQTNDWKYCPIF